MHTRRAVALLIAAILIPLAVNIDAYRGYFEDDDFSTLVFAKIVPLRSYVADIPCIAYPCQHNRPTGFLFYGALFDAARLHYAPWVLTLQFIVCVNVVLLWFLLRKIGFEEITVAAGCIFFVTARALFDVWWKPSYIYDVLCTTFALAALLAYAHRTWVLSFIAFWLAMRSKEIGMVVPAMLLCYEFTLGSRNWKRVSLFFLPAVIYGAYGLRFNMKAATGTEYSLGHTPFALWNAVSYYSSKLFWIPYAGLLLLASPLFARDRRLYFGVAAMACGIGIYVLMPDRLFDAYLYLAAVGTAIAIAALVSRWPRVIAVLAIVWVPWQVVLIRNHAHMNLAAARERRAFIEALRTIPDAPAYTYASAPSSFQRWGVEGALRFFHGIDLPIHALPDPVLPPDPRMFLVSWEPKTRQLDAQPFAPLNYTSLAGDATPAPWQTYGNWTDHAGAYREFQKSAAMRLYRPANAKELTWESCGDELQVSLDGRPLHHLKFPETRCVITRVPVVTPVPKIVTIDFTADHPTKIGRVAFE